MLSCVYEDVYALWNWYFVNTRVISESFIIHPISDHVTRCCWLWMADDYRCCQHDKTLVRIL